MLIVTIDIIPISWHHNDMRSTLAIDDAVLDELKSYSEFRRISLGQAASILIMRAVRMETPTKVVNGLTVFDLPADTPAVTSEDVKRLEEELP